MVLLLVLLAVHATSIPIGKILLQYSAPMFLAGIRMAIAGILMLGYQYFIAHKHFMLKKKHWLYYVQIILFGVYFKYTLRYWGLAHMSTAKTAFLFNLTPFMVALFSYLFLHDRMTTKQWIGLMIGFCGILPILATSSSTEQFLGEFATVSWAELAIIGQAASYAYYIVLMRKLMQESGYKPAMLNGIATFAGGSLALLTGFVIGAPMTVSEPVPFAGWLALIIVVSNLICHNFYAYLLNYYSATFMSWSEFLGPIFAAFYGWLFFGDVITWHYGLSALLVMSGLYVFYQDEFSIYKAAPTATT